MKALHFISYALLRSFLSLCAFLPYKALHFMGKVLGNITYPLLTRYRKRALSNLAIASDLNLSNQEIRSLAKKSLCNLFMTSLEYGKLSKEKDIFKVATCMNPEEANEILKQGKGIIFFCAHQANWEILFLEGTSRMKGTAIGQPVANTYLYNWISRMREKFGGVMILPKQAVKEGLRTLKKGHFLGIVGDQGMPEGGFKSSFLGRIAYTSPLPALLSHRSGSPIIFATTLREKGKYFIHYSSPIWPDSQKSMEEDIPILMNKTLSLLEESIKKRPEEWLWQHNKWKQQGPGKLKRKYRQDTLAIFLPLENKECEALIDLLKTLREIYPTEWISCFVPQGFDLPIEIDETVIYKNAAEAKKEDYRFKLVFNFTADSSLKEHFLKLSAFEVLSLTDVKSPSQLKELVSYAS